MSISLRQIRSFLAVADLKSFTRAAASLNLSQPALTVQIRGLEEALGVRLLDRDTRTVDLTRTGRDLAPLVRRLLNEFDTLVADTRDLAAGRRGVIRIAALPSLAAGLVPDAIRRFREIQPHASIVIKDVIAARVLALVRSEDVDLGIVGGAVTEPGLEVLIRSRDRLHIVFPRGHLIGEEPAVTFESFSALPLVLMDRETSVRAVVDAAFVSAGTAPILACEATYMMTAVGMVRAGLGLTILPASAREIRAEPALASRPIDGPGFSRTIALIKRAGRTLPPLSEAFVAVLSQALLKSNKD